MDFDCRLAYFLLISTPGIGPHCKFQILTRDLISRNLSKIKKSTIVSTTNQRPSNTKIHRKRAQVSWQTRILQKFQILTQELRCTFLDETAVSSEFSPRLRTEDSMG